MTQFRLIKRTRQLTEYSCGASALQSVASHWGKEIDEDALMKLMGTNAEVGTFPEDMVRGARALGLDAELLEPDAMRARKLGLSSVTSDADASLVDDLDELLEAAETDYTIFFRNLSEWAVQDGEADAESFLERVSPAFYDEAVAPVGRGAVCRGVIEHRHKRTLPPAGGGVNILENQ